jgi:cation-transporting ATPase E
MTGDGVNDILALKEANCSVAMASGSAAARNVADIVLADSDFAHMPEVVAEGRRSINNLQRSAALFLMKTVYSAALALVCVFMPPFPLLPIQMSLVSTAIIYFVFCRLLAFLLGKLSKRLDATNRPNKIEGIDS